MTIVEPKNSILDYSKLTKKGLIDLLNESDTNQKKLQDNLSKITKDHNDCPMAKLSLVAEKFNLEVDILRVKSKLLLYQVTSFVFILTTLGMAFSYSYLM